MAKKNRADNRPAEADACVVAAKPSTHNDTAGPGKSLQWDAEKAADFLASWPTDATNLTAIQDQEGPKGFVRNTWFEKNNRAGIIAFINEHQGKGRNVYFGVNNVPRDLRRATKKDLTTMVAALVDIDHKNAETSIAGLKAYRPRVSAIVQSSQEGVQGFWFLAVHKPLNGDAAAIEDAERINQKLALHFGGDRAVKDPSRIMRVPWTINFLSVSKVKEGRTPFVAQVIEVSGAQEVESKFKRITDEELKKLKTRDEAPKKGAHKTIDDGGDAPEDGTTYAEWWAAGRAKEIRETPESARNQNTLIATGAAHLATMLPHKWIAEKRITEILLEAGRAGNHPEERILPAIESGIRTGKELPPHKLLKKQEQAPPGAILIEGGQQPRIVDQAEAALLNSPCNFYQRGGSMIVRPVFVKEKAAKGRTTYAHRLVPVSHPHLREEMTRAATFMKFNGRSGKWVPIDCPPDVAAAYSAREGKWKLRPLKGIINAPTIREDGSLLTQPGYDDASELLFEPNGVTFPEIPDQPTKDHAAKALEVLMENIATFPFVAEVDRSVMLAGKLTSMVRRSLHTAPMMGFDAPMAGSGKTKLVDILSIMLTGQLAAVMTHSANPEEFEKRLVAALIAGHSHIAIDNVEGDIGGDLLCQMLTQANVDVRMLGQSKLIRCPTGCLTTATGNNLQFVGDVTRRTLKSNIDPGVENPSKLVFHFDPCDRTMDHRGELVAAALTIMRAYHVAGEPAVPCPAFGSFEEWSARVRKPLLWLGCIDPCGSVDELQADDPKRLQLARFIQAWHAEDPQHEPRRVQDIIDLGETLEGPLMEIAGGREGGVSSMRLGRWIKGNKSRIIDGYHIAPAGSEGGYPLYVLEGPKGPAKKAPAWQIPQTTRSYAGDFYPDDPGNPGPQD
jgi:hypothetical protein